MERKNYLEKLKEYNLTKELLAETFILSEALTSPGLFERCEKDGKDIIFLLNKVEHHKEVFNDVLDYLLHVSICNEIAIEEFTEYYSKREEKPSTKEKIKHFK